MSTDTSKIIPFPTPRSTQEQAAIRSNEVVHNLLLALRAYPASARQLARLDEQIRKIEDRIRAIKEGRWR